ncbi:MAG: Do family serine endopeptidase [Bryobacterales bacterium]|nr:Do family serine endopeptidase [Bryobacterales bacterium]
MQNAGFLGDAPPAATTGERTGPPAGRVQSYSDVVAKVAPAVVTIRSERRTRAAEEYPFSGFPFGLPFGNRGGGGRGQPMPRGRGGVERGLGSGVIVRADGYCLTNHHVVDGAQEIQVELNDGRRVPAKLVGSDAPSDLALLKIDVNSLPVLRLGNSDDVRVGDVALAVGNPLGVGQTVTMGIISAKNRTTGVGEGTFEDFLQTDAPINQGNSGGALVNTSGELIGINSQILSTSGGSIGIGFAIPSNMARTVMEQLASKGKVSRGQIGIGIQQVTPEIARSLGRSDMRGVLVNSVSPGSPAEKAGLKTGDVITKMNGQEIRDLNLFRNRVASSGPGAEITLTVNRDGRDQDIRVRLGEFQARRDDEPGGGAEGGPAGGRLGISVEPLTPEVAARLGLRSADGLLVREVDPAGAAADAGITDGDVIVQANRKPVRSVSDLEAIVRGAGSNPVLLLVNRGGQTVFVPVTPRAGR